MQFTFCTYTNTKKNYEVIHTNSLMFILPNNMFMKQSYLSDTRTDRI